MLCNIPCLVFLDLPYVFRLTCTQCNVIYGLVYLAIFITVWSLAIIRPLIFFLCFWHFFDQNSMREGAKKKKVKKDYMKFYEIPYFYMDRGDIPQGSSRVGAKHTGCGGRCPWFTTTIFIVKNHIIENFHIFLTTKLKIN